MSPQATLPPGPASPAFWQLLRYSQNSIPVLESCAKKFRTPFTLHLAGYGKLVIFDDSPSVRDIFRADPAALHSGEGNEFLAITVGTNSVLVLDDARHQRQRAALLPAVRGERMRSMADAMHAETRAAIEPLTPGTRFTAMPAMRRIALRVILRSTLGIPAGPDLDRFEHLVESLLAQSRSRHTLLLVKVVPMAAVRSPLFSFQRRLRALDRALFELIAQRRAQSDPQRPPNILDDLLAARDAQGNPFSDAELRDAVVSMIFAGYDTTAVALAWALEQIVPRPDVIDKIRAEAATADPTGKRPYLEAAIKESLRLRTLFPFVVRLTKRPFTAGNREYPPGVLLCPCIHLIHRRPDLYPDPERFNPERFLTRSFAADEWLPFGGGNRACIGMAFAITEMKIILENILTRLTLQRPPGAGSHPVRRGIALAPHDDCRLIVKSRP